MTGTARTMSLARHPRTVHPSSHPTHLESALFFIPGCHVGVLSLVYWYIYRTSQIIECAEHNAGANEQRRKTYAVFFRAVCISLVDRTPRELMFVTLNDASFRSKLGFIDG